LWFFALACGFPRQLAAIYAEGKENAMAVGITKMSTADIKSINKV
jgi:hypothetical protein